MSVDAIEDRSGLPAGLGGLAELLGPTTEDAAAKPLDRSTREAIVAWRDAEWAHLEAGAGPLAGRDPDHWYRTLTREAWRDAEGGGRGLPPWLLAAFYRAKPLIPRRVQLALRRRLVRRQGLPAFPDWPFDDVGLRVLRIEVAETMLALGVDAISFPWFWPDGARAAVALTHDVESDAGLAAAATVAAWEEERGLRSSFNVVADWYPIDREVLADLRDRGHEVGSHAIHHDRSLFSSREEFDRQVPLLREAAADLGAVGFRSPATHRVVDWLPDLPFAYDCTMPHSDPYEPIPGGTATVWPFALGDLVELPYTAPQDHTLFNLLGHTDASLWTTQLKHVVAANGLFQPLTHPDPGYLGRPAVGSAYRTLLDAIAAREDLWTALPREIVDWWVARRAGSTAPDSGTARWTPTGPRLEPSAARA